jgi:hypothetical protein
MPGADLAAVEITVLGDAAGRTDTAAERDTDRRRPRTVMRVR